MIDVNKIVNVELSIIEDNVHDINTYSTCVYLIHKDTGILEGKKLYNSLSELLEDYANATGSGVNDLIINAKQYFNNGGQRLLVYPMTSYTATGLNVILSDVRTEVDDFIFIVISAQCLGDGKYTLGANGVLKELCEYVEDLSSPYKVRLCVTTDSKTFISDNGLSTYSVAVKYSKTMYNGKLIDAALLIPAYFSKLRLDDASSIKDYCYTAEKLYDIETGDNKDGACNVTSAEYDELVQNNYNFIDKIGNNIINFGGNFSNGNAIVLEFGVIAIENEICYEVLNNIVGKQYLTENGLTNVASIIDSILNKYTINGFINVECSYSGDDYVYGYNGKKYNVIRNGELLQKGYKVYTIPISSISREDYKEKKFTPVVIAMETNKGARVIAIRGVVR